MARKKLKKPIELTDTEKEMLQEIIRTYQGMKMMSRLMRWIAFFIFLLILNFARLTDAIDNIFIHFKQWFSKN
ncbi:hypothetical protein [Bartonella japonica]|uniref:hypothetical protein n=1 Tax=Bartonella japonica TaxID=357761 RepID=UPI00339594EB